MRETRKTKESERERVRERERERERGNFGRTQNVQEVVVDVSIKAKVCFHLYFKYFLISIFNLLWCLNIVSDVYSFLNY